eukprot:Gb_10514 [translate_table: standard]
MGFWCWIFGAMLGKVAVLMAFQAVVRNGFIIHLLHDQVGSNIQFYGFWKFDFKVYFDIDSDHNLVACVEGGTIPPIRGESMGDELGIRLGALVCIEVHVGCTRYSWGRTCAIGTMCVLGPLFCFVSIAFSLAIRSYIWSCLPMLGSLLVELFCYTIFLLEQRAGMELLITVTISFLVTIALDVHARRLEYAARVIYNCVVSQGLLNGLLSCLVINGSWTNGVCCVGWERQLTSTSIGSVSFLPSKAGAFLFLPKKLVISLPLLCLGLKVLRGLLSMYLVASLCALYRMMETQNEAFRNVENNEKDNIAMPKMGIWEECQ